MMMRARAFRAFLVDDERIVRSVLKSALVAAGIFVVGEAGSGEEALQALALVSPDLVLIDIGLPGMSGLELIRRLQTCAPTTRTIVVTGSSEGAGAVEALAGGAHGYVIKDAEPEEIARAARAVAEGRSVVCPEAIDELIDRIRQRDTPATSGEANLSDVVRTKLTEREVEVLELIAQGRSNETIARQIHVSPGTVKNHVAAILQKLDLENRIQAAVLAVRAGLA
jgi:DNA-binding NarL/FixJ family response regulator